VPGWNKVDFLSDPNDPEISEKLIANEDIIRQAFKSAGFDYAEHINNRNPDGNGPKAYAVHNLDWHTEAALNFIDQNKENPFFLYFATTIPHGPGSRDRSWGADRRITPYGLLDKPLRILSSEEEIEERLKNSGIEIDARQFDQKANLLWMDDALGEIIKKLEEYGIDDNTIIFFFNDHGQGAKGTLYESGIRNPSIAWRKKGFKSGEVSAVRISNIDFAPTILDFAGIEIESQQFDGKSFKNTLLDGSNEEIHESMYFEMGFTRALIKGDYKYLALRYPESLANMSDEERKQTLEDAIDRLKIRGIAPITADPSAPFSHLSPIPGGWDSERSSTGEYPFYYDRDQLYNIIKDPGELENLAEKDAEILLELKEELNKYVMDLPGTFNTN
jgi:arylsulfatase A-like enzyme